MHIGHFYRSARAIGIWLPRFIQQGMTDAALPLTGQLARLRPLGMACENHMFRATDGINTHKGSVFSLGLLCCAFGRLHQQRQKITAKTLCDTVAAMCAGLVERELRCNNSGQTAGQRLFAKQGLGGARAEAESGFRLVIEGALPIYRQRLHVGEQVALMDSLLWLMANNGDTNVASRGGMAGLHWLQQRAQQLLAQGGAGAEQGLARLQQFDCECIDRHLSPGGSADLLIVTWLLAQLPQTGTEE
jgi:triphosphoribosyl-dephospho-CoA synthase